MRIVLDLQGAQSDSRFRGIGRYSLALAEAIAREAGEHDVWVALSGRFPDSIEPLRATFAYLIPPENIRVFELPGPVAEYEPSNAWRMQAAELLRENFLADLRPDIVHVSTLFEGWANEVVASIGRFDSTIPTAVTQYDLIPMLYPEIYFASPAAKRSYLRRMQSLKRADLLLAISGSTSRETIETLHIPSERIVNIGAGLQPGFRPADISPEATTALMKRCGLRGPFVLYTGGSDPRKNLEGLIAAFALLPRDLRSAYQLALVGKFDERQRLRLASLGHKLGLVNDEVVYVGYTSDEDLRLLYSACALFVLPSLHEGFGLPVLEAMACGSPVIGSNCTSIPEIINRDDALFDPQQPRDIAGRIVEVLSNVEFCQNLKNWGRERAKAFTWEACARKTLRAFEALNAERRSTHHVGPGATTSRRPLLAFVTLIGPDQTGIAADAARLLPSLSRHYEIVCIADEEQVTDSAIAAGFAIRDVRWFETNAGSFERILYQFGDSPAHKHMFGLLERHPGVVVLDDFHLGSVLNWMESSGYASGSFTKALYDSHGISALNKDRVGGREASIETFPCNAAVLRDSIGVIVHCNRALELARVWYGDRAQARMRHIPLVHSASEPGDRTASQATSHLNQQIHPEWMAEQYREVIEEFYATSPKAREEQLVQAIARTLAPPDPMEGDLAAVAVALAANRERFGQLQVLIDVTILAKSDARTGIQRATRGILMALIADPPAGYRIEPVRAVTGGYLYARRFTSQCLGLSNHDLTDEPVEVGHNDIFVGLDWCADFVFPSVKPWFLAQRRHGVRIVFVAYDMLPLFRPELFPSLIPPIATDWNNTVAEVADCVACISRTVTSELCEWLCEAKLERLRPMSLGYFHLGADLHATLPTKGLSEDAFAILTKVRSRPSFLMVGTLEARKGHRQAVDAMEQLWADKVDANLVIVGNQGWKTEDLVERIQRHPELNDRLFWLQGISDEMLEQLYRSARALLAASEGEGFGLPLIEAAQYQLRIIARDIPVFREVAGEHAYYFRGEDASELADAMRSWLMLGDAAPASTGIPWLTWQQSSRQFLDVVLGKRWHCSWPDKSTEPGAGWIGGKFE